MSSSNLYLPQRKNSTRLAWYDLRESLTMSWFWITLGWNDILQRYRGSLLGPFWITITTGIFIAGLGPLYAKLFSLDMKVYLPFMAIGVTTWQFITGTIVDSCNTFIGSSHLMKQMKVPRSALLLRVVWRNIISFLHNVPIYIAIIFLFGQPINWTLIGIIPGFFLVCLNLIWMGLVVAIVCTRFRDIGPIIGSILQIGFFVTPVIWNHKMQDVPSIIVNINPFAAFIELIRAPMMGEWVSTDLILLALAFLCFGSIVAVALFIRCRSKIIYWV